jgi:hypothetical protein
MKRIATILSLLIGLCNFASGQVFPDSLKNTFVAQLKNRDTLTIYVSRENCFYFGFQKFQLTKQDKQYNLLSFIPIPAYSLHLNRTQCQSVFIDTLKFKVLNTYSLADSNVIAFAQIEMLGLKCGIKPRGPGGAIGIYKMILNNKEKQFSNMCYNMKDLEKIAIPEKFYEDRDEQEE